MGRKSATGIDGLRLCSICKNRKPTSEFYLCRRNRNGIEKMEFYAYCKSCDAARALAYYEKHRAEKKAYQEKNREHKIKYLRKYRRDNPERTKRQAHENYVNNRTSEMVKRAGLKFAFGISLEDYNILLEKQRGVCAICGKLEEAFIRHSTKTKMLAVDHDHKTGKIRGLLCRNCNIGMGCLKDDPVLLRLAIKYIESFSR